MTDIPVKHRIKALDRRFLPLWALAVVLIVVGVVLGLRHNESKRSADSAPSVSRPCGDDGDCGDRQLCLSATCVDIKPGLPECAEIQVHFNTDSADIREADKPAVLRLARCLKADQTMKLAVVGTADERGTHMHNLELGEKRAMAVAKTLQQNGVSRQQLSIASYGENRPLCLESDRDCWARNRQASLVPKEGAIVTK